MTKIVMTGQSGFIGYHLTQYFKYLRSDFQIIPFQDEYYNSSSSFDNVIKDADIIIHLAGINRGNDETIYKSNIKLVSLLIESLDRIHSKAHIIFASSIKENDGSPYGVSKKESRLMLSNWAKINRALFTGLIIPNVFGPFGLPNYNSVIATFCYNLNNQIESNILMDNLIGFLYVHKLAEDIVQVIVSQDNNEAKIIQPEFEMSISSLLNCLKSYKDSYLDNKIIPILKKDYEINLFNTFRSYINPVFFPLNPEIKSDSRGSLFEIIRSNIKSQIFYSTTKPGQIRGNHFHFYKVERFCIISGKAEINVRRIGTKDTIKYKIEENIPAIIDIPIMHTHNVVNIGENELKMLFWTNEFFDPDNSDTYYEVV